MGLKGLRLSFFVKCWQTYILVFNLFLMSMASAQTTAPFFHFEGQLADSSGDPVLDSDVDFTVTVLSPDNSCILYEEKFTSVDLSGSNGNFNLQIGTAAAALTSKDLNLSPHEVFANNKSIACTTSDPAIVYNPGIDDHRNIRITADASSLGGIETLPSISLGSTPSAFVANTLQGLLPTDFVQVSKTLSNVGIGVSTADVSALLELKSTSKGFLPPRMTSGQRDLIPTPKLGLMIFNTTDNELNLYNGSWESVKVGGGSEASQVLTGTSQPTGTAAGEVFYNTSDEKMYIYNGSSWEAVASGSANIATGDGVHIPQQSTTPGTPVEGQMYFNTTDHELQVYNGSSWEPLGGGVQSVLQDDDGDTKVMVEQSPDEDAIRLQTAGNEVLTLLSSGSVGVNQLSPLRTLSVGGTLGITGSDNAYTTAGWNRAIELEHSSAVVWKKGSGDASWGIGKSTNSPSRMYIFSSSTDDNSTTPDYKMVISQTGNVGVGDESSPKAKLDVQGEVKIGNTNATCDASREGAMRYNSSSKKMEFCNGSVWGAVDGGGAVVGAGPPVGSIVTMMTSSCPTGYLPATGTEVSRSTYANLYAAISTMYGDGNGSSTFNLPDLRGYFLRGVDGGAGRDPDAASRLDRGDGLTGDRVGTVQMDANASHLHGQGTLGGSTSANGDHSHAKGTLGGATSTTGAHSHSYTDRYHSAVMVDDNNNEWVAGPSLTSGSYTTGSAGNHSHTLNITGSTATTGSHAHTLNITGSTASAGGSESRPKNINVLYCIKH